MGTIILATALVVVAVISAVAYVVGQKRAARPTRELARAVRCLDQILAYDDAMTSLSNELRTEARRITNDYHKELN